MREKLFNLMKQIAPELSIPWNRCNEQRVRDFIDTLNDDEVLDEIEYWEYDPIKKSKEAE